jgi:hypothetical protein
MKGHCSLIGLVLVVWKPCPKKIFTPGAKKRGIHSK